MSRHAGYSATTASSLTTVRDTTPAKPGAGAKLLAGIRRLRPSSTWLDHAPEIVRGLRAAATTVVPVVLSFQPGRIGLIWMALGGWIATFCDPGGSRAKRTKLLSFLLVFGSLAVSVAARPGVHGAPAMALLGVAAFFGAFLRIFGIPWAITGTMVAICVSVASAHSVYTTQLAGLYFGAGVASSIALTSVVWPVWADLPLQRAVGAAYGELGAFAAAIDALLVSGTLAGSPAWSEAARRHQRCYRMAAQAAHALAATGGSGQTWIRALFGLRPPTVRAHLRELLAAADEQFFALISFTEEVEAVEIGDRPTRDERRLDEVAAGYAWIARVLSAPFRRADRVPSRTSALAAPASDHPVFAIAARVHAAVFPLQLRAARLDAVGKGAPQPPAKRPSLRGAVLALRADLALLVRSATPRSPSFCHGLRVSFAAMVAAVVGARFSDHPEWVGITMLAVLQPYPSFTAMRARHRIIGTFLGGVVATVVTMAAPAPIYLAIAMFPLAVLAMSLQAKSYRLFTFFLTPMFILLATRHPGDWWPAAARFGDTLLAVGIAWIASVVVFPSRESGRLADAMVAMLRATGAYADAVLASFERRDEGGVDARVAASRRSAGAALEDAEAALDRLRSEPGRDEKAMSDALQLITRARRAMSAIVAVDRYVVDGASEESSGVRARRASGYVGGVVRAAETFVRSGARRDGPDLPAIDDAHADPHVHAAMLRLLGRVTLVGELTSRAVLPMREDRDDRTPSSLYRLTSRAR